MKIKAINAASLAYLALFLIEAEPPVINEMSVVQENQKDIIEIKELFGLRQEQLYFIMKWIERFKIQ